MYVRARLCTHNTIFNIASNSSICVDRSLLHVFTILSLMCSLRLYVICAMRIAYNIYCWMPCDCEDCNFQNLERQFIAWHTIYARLAYKLTIANLCAISFRVKLCSAGKIDRIEREQCKLIFPFYTFCSTKHIISRIQIQHDDECTNNANNSWNLSHT